MGASKRDVEERPGASVPGRDLHRLDAGWDLCRSLSRENRWTSLQGAPLDFDLEDDPSDVRELVEAVDHDQLVDAVENVPVEGEMTGRTVEFESVSW